VGGLDTGSRLMAPRRSAQVTVRAAGKAEASEPTAVEA
jgi:hypothetical protein